MPLGPVEILVVQFPGNEVKGDIVPAIKELVENGTIRVIDILFIKKDQDGNVTMREINDLDDASFAAFNPIVAEVDGLVSRDDIQQLAATLKNRRRQVVAFIALFSEQEIVQMSGGSSDV